MKNVVAQSHAMRPLVEAVLDADDLLRSYRAATVDALADIAMLSSISPLDAVELGQHRERSNVLAFLRSRRGAAETVARTNPAEEERARTIMQQINVEIESIEQGLHEGCALKEADLADAARAAERVGS